MTDMSSVIVPKSDQWNADDFIAGPRNFTIREVQIKASEEQPVNILLEGSNKAFRPCKSMSRCMVTAWGADAKKYVGRSLTLYRDPAVKWGGLEVGGIRISHLSHIENPMQMMLTATRGSRKPHKVLPLANAPTEQPDYSAQLAVLESAASFGEDALKAKWQEVGPDVRKALAGELDRLKSLVPAAQPQQQEDDGYAGV